MAGAAVRLYIRIRKIPGSNLGGVIRSPDKVLCDFTGYLPEDKGTITRLGH